MALYDRKCPACGATVSRIQVPKQEPGGWPCPACGQRLRSARVSIKPAWVISLAISAGACLFFKLSGSTSVVVILIASLPLSFIVHGVIGLFLSIPLELFNERRQHVSRYDKKCPSCGEIISPTQVPRRQPAGFPCPACGRRLKLSALPMKLTVPIALAVSASLCFFFGLRGLTAILLSLAVAVPLQIIVHTAIALAFPLRIDLVSPEDDHPTKLIG